MHSGAVFGRKYVQYSCSDYETFVKHRDFQKLKSAPEGPERPIGPKSGKKERTFSFTLAEGSQLIDFQVEHRRIELLTF